MLVGMAYVVRRPGGRFEIRESVHTSKGPRARSLANFAVLDEQILAVAGARSLRPFNAAAVLAAARRVSAPVVETASTMRPARAEVSDADEAQRRFVASSRRMAREIERVWGPLSDPGTALIELFDFAEAVRRSQPPRPAEELDFPPLNSLAGGSPRRVPPRKR